MDVSQPPVDAVEADSELFVIDAGRCRIVARNPWTAEAEFPRFCGQAGRDPQGKDRRVVPLRVVRFVIQVDLARDNE